MEIKFRAYIKSQKRIVEVKSIHFGTGRINISGNSGNYSVDREDYMLLQYTGFVDKKGIEIYEGDILSTKGVGQSCYDNSDPNVRVVGRYYKTNELCLFGLGNSYPATGIGLSDTTKNRFTITGNVYEKGYNAP